MNSRHALYECHYAPKYKYPAEDKAILLGALKGFKYISSIRRPKSGRYLSPY
jgi:hypothetical protein